MKPGDPPFWPSAIRAFVAQIKHPFNALKIGKPLKGDISITQNSVRFANRGAIDNSSGSVLTGGESGQINAFRHTLWQSQITNQFGVGQAKEHGDAHEANPNADLTKRVFQGEGAELSADMTVDLLNNMIGRGIGASNEGLGMKDMALKVLDEFRTNGLYTSTQQSDGSFKVGKSKITLDQWKALQSRFNSLDNNGETKSEAEDKKKKILNQSYQNSKNPPIM